MKFLSISVAADASEAPEIINLNSAAARTGKRDPGKRLVNALAKPLGQLAAVMAVASLAHAAPSIDMSGVTSVMQTVETACLLIGAIIVLISLIFSVFSFAGGNVMRGITGVAGVLFGGLVIGLGPTWITSLTGQGV